MVLRALSVLMALAFASPLAAAETVRLGLLSFGTVQWEVDTMRAEGLDKAHGIAVEPVVLANKNGAAVALHGGAVDAIVSDWLWVSRQRALGDDLTFVPWSSMGGMLLVPAGSPIAGLGQLAGKRLGIAGGPLDKGWLLLRALAARQHGLDLDKAVEKSFAAPPLLKQEFEAGRLDALLTFWQHGVPLEMAGARNLIQVAAIPEMLGIGAGPPLLGWVFRGDWARANPGRIRGLEAAAADTKRRMCASAEPWTRIAPMTGAADPASLDALRHGFCRGIPGKRDEAEVAQAGRLFALMAELGGAELVGPSNQLQDGTFWTAR